MSFLGTGFLDDIVAHPEYRPPITMPVRRTPEFRPPITKPVRRTPEFRPPITMPLPIPPRRWTGFLGDEVPPYGTLLPDDPLERKHYLATYARVAKHVGDPEERDVETALVTRLSLRIQQEEDDPFIRTLRSAQFILGVEPPRSQEVRARMLEALIPSIMGHRRLDDGQKMSLVYFIRDMAEKTRKELPLNFPKLPPPRLDSLGFFDPPQPIGPEDQALIKKINDAIWDATQKIATVDFVMEDPEMTEENLRRVVGILTKAKKSHLEAISAAIILIKKGLVPPPAFLKLSNAMAKTVGRLTSLVKIASIQRFPGLNSLGFLGISGTAEEVERFILGTGFADEKRWEVASQMAIAEARRLIEEALSKKSLKVANKAVILASKSLEASFWSGNKDLEEKAHDAVVAASGMLNLLEAGIEFEKEYPSIPWIPFP